MDLCARWGWGRAAIGISTRARLWRAWWGWGRATSSPAVGRALACHCGGADLMETSLLCTNPTAGCLKPNRGQFASCTCNLHPHPPTHPPTLAEYLRICGRAGDLQAAQAAWRDAQRLKVQPDLILFSAMIDACAKVGA